MPRLHTLVLAFMLGWACLTDAFAQDMPELRFLYVVNCDASVDKIDTYEYKKPISFHLSQRSGNPPAVPSLASSDWRLDGCLAQQTLRYVVNGKERVSLITPKKGRTDSKGLQEFQILTFSLPDWHLLSVTAAGKYPEAPRLEQDATGALKALPLGTWMPPNQLDLTQYQGLDNLSGRNMLIQTSGSMALLRLFTDDPQQLLLGLADTRAKYLITLTNIPTTPLSHVFLAPGGNHVLVELVKRADSPGQASQRTGVLRLYDVTGKQVAQVEDEAIRTMQFVALAPNGVAVYRIGAHYHLVHLGITFGTATVTPSPFTSSGLLPAFDTVFATR